MAEEERSPGTRLLDTLRIPNTGFTITSPELDKPTTPENDSAGYRERQELLRQNREIAAVGQGLVPETSWQGIRKTFAVDPETLAARQTAELEELGTHEQGGRDADLAELGRMIAEPAPEQPPTKPISSAKPRPPSLFGK